MDPIPANLIAIVLLLAAAIAAAGLLRWARAPGAAVIGGAIAGILLGPTIFGRVMPTTYEELFIGGASQREQLEQAARGHHAELLAAQEAGTDQAAVEQMQHDHETELRTHQRTLEEARWSHQRPMRYVVFAIVGATLLIGGLRRIAPGNAPRSWGSAVSIGLWSATLPGALTLLAMRWWWEHDLAESALVAAAVAIGPWALTDVDRRAADEAEHGGAWMMQTAGRMATIVAILVAGGAMWLAGGVQHLLWASVLLMLPLGWAIARLTAAGGVRSPSARGHETGEHSRELEPRGATSDVSGQARDHADRGRGYLIAEHALLPALAACAAVRIELLEHFAFWPVLVLILISGDGRWLGAVTGALLLGSRSTLRTMRLVLGSMACGPTQLAVLALAVHTWTVPDELPLALLVGAAVIEATATARRKISRELADAEVELSDFDRDS